MTKLWTPSRRIIQPRRPAVCPRCGGLSRRWLRDNRHHAGMSYHRVCCCESCETTGYYLWSCCRGQSVYTDSDMSAVLGGVILWNNICWEVNTGCLDDQVIVQVTGYTVVTDCDDPSCPDCCCRRNWSYGGSIGTCCFSSDSVAKVTYTYSYTGTSGSCVCESAKGTHTVYLPLKDCFPLWESAPVMCSPTQGIQFSLTYDASGAWNFSFNGDGVSSAGGQPCTGATFSGTGNTNCVHPNQASWDAVSVEILYNSCALVGGNCTHE